jgi:hypothetical protein
LEVTSSCWEVARILEPHVDRVVVVSADDTRLKAPDVCASLRQSPAPTRHANPPDHDRQARSIPGSPEHRAKRVDRTHVVAEDLGEAL